MQHMDPAKTILDRIGYQKAAEITGKSISRVYRWAMPSGPKEGTGGIIPHKDALKLIAYCREAGLPFTEADFMREPSPVAHAEEHVA